MYANPIARELRLLLRHLECLAPSEDGFYERFLGCGISIAKQLIVANEHGFSDPILDELVQQYTTWKYEEFVEKVEFNAKTKAYSFFRVFTDGEYPAADLSDYVKKHWIQRFEEARPFDMPSWLRFDPSFRSWREGNAKKTSRIVSETRICIDKDASPTPIRDRRRLQVFWEDLLYRSFDSNPEPDKANHSNLLRAIEICRDFSEQMTEADLEINWHKISLENEEWPNPDSDRKRELKARYEAVRNKKVTIKFADMYDKRSQLREFTLENAYKKKETARRKQM